MIENYGLGMWEENINKKITFIEELRIGKEAGDDLLMFRNNLDICVDSDSNIYVLDMGNCRLIKFNKIGKHILTIGREGQGPGEFQSPSEVILNQLQDIYVLDNNYSVHMFDAKGGYKRTFKMDRSIEKFQPMNDGRFFTRIEIPKQTGLRGAYYSSEFRYLKEFPIEYPYGPKISGSGNIGGDMKYMHDKIFMVLPDKYEIHEYNLDGKLLRKIKRDFDFKPPLVKRLEGGGFAIGGKTKLGPCFIDKQGFFINEIFKLGGSNETDIKLIFLLDIFSSDGEFLGSYRLPEWTKLITIDSENKFYFVTLDPFPSVIRSALKIS